MSDHPRHTYSYRDAGVDVETGRKFVDLIKPLAKGTATIGSAAELGGFGAVFDIRAAGFKDPVLVAASDGVGTKLLIANALGQHKTVGIDLVAMSVNDIIVQGAKPLFFLDYFSTGHLDVKTATEVVEGIAIGCRRANCALIGGETAEMPGLYAAGQYDLAGFAVGAIERNQILTGNTISPGDQVLGLTSSGIHANGFSLVRKIITDNEVNLEGAAPFNSQQRLADTLLAPTRIYVNSVLTALDEPGHGVKGIAHITGGGFHENLPRILPNGVSAKLNASTWPLPEIFYWLRQLGNIDCEEMTRTFNCGIGMLMVIKQNRLKHLKNVLSAHGETVYHVGEIVPSDRPKESVIIDNLETAWK